MVYTEIYKLCELYTEYIWNCLVDANTAGMYRSELYYEEVMKTQ